MSETNRSSRQASAVPAVSPADAGGEAQVAGGTATPQSEVCALQTTVLELRRKTTIMAAELYELEEIRAFGQEAAMQLVEARSQIVVSNNRRKEMARVIANRNAKIEDLNRTNELRNQELQNVSAMFKVREEGLRTCCEKLEAEVQDAKSRIMTSQARRKEMGLLIAKRDATISALRNQLQSAQEQVAALKRHVRSSVSWWLSKMVR